MDEISAAKLITYFIKKYIKEKKEDVFKINTRATYQRMRRRLHLKKAFEQVKNLFENIDSKAYYRFMNAIDKRLPKSNMHKHYRSMATDLGLAKLLGSKYVGDVPVWEADYVFPPEVTIPTEEHSKYENKTQMHMFQACGDTSTFTVKNIRGEGKIVDIDSIAKNIFILVESSYPFRIAIAYPDNIRLFVKHRRKAQIYDEFKKELKRNGGVCAELYGYFMKKDLDYIDIPNKPPKDNSEPNGDLMRESLEYFLKDLLN
jgi:hypothetical protein